VNWLQSLGDNAKNLLPYYSTPLPSIYLNELKKLWRISQNMSQEAILKSLESFKDQHPIPETNQQKPSTEEVEKEIKIKLIGYITVTN
jgi:hypothetical protein